MGQWTDLGFVVTPKSEYKSMIQGVFKEAFGNDFALDDTLPQGILIERLAELFYSMDLDGVEAFTRLNLNTLGGLFLDNVGNMRGIPRLMGTPQSGMVKITCNASNFMPFSIPANTEIRASTSSDTFKTTTLTTITAPTDVSLAVEYVENGNSSAIVGDTFTITGFPQITNIELTSLFDGSSNESDVEYRRRLQVEYPAAVGTIEYVETELRKIPSLKSVGHLYNDTSTTDGNDVPAYCTEWVVAPKAGLDESGLGVFKTAVGKTILDNKVPGSPTSGNTSVTTADAFGTQKTVNFTLATKVEVEIEVTVGTPETTGMLDLSHRQAIQEAIRDYINNLEIGKDVAYSRCMAPLTADTGFDVLTFRMRDKNDGAWVSNGNLSIGLREYAETTTADINIGV